MIRAIRILYYTGSLINLYQLKSKLEMELSNARLDKRNDADVLRSIVDKLNIQIQDYINKLHKYL